MTHRNFWLALGLLLAACNNRGTLLHSYKPLPAEGWERRDTVRFLLPEAEADIDGTLFIGLRTTAGIGIRNIVLAIEQCLDAPHAYRCDTVSYPLTDAEGYALTKGVNHYQYETQQLPLHMQKGQSGSVRIHHLMTNEVIPNITEVGIRLDK
jgi:gliding motility-associated lipoprotein GldH